MNENCRSTRPRKGWKRILKWTASVIVLLSDPLAIYCLALDFEQRLQAIRCSSYESHESYCVLRLWVAELSSYRKSKNLFLHDDQLWSKFARLRLIRSIGTLLKVRHISCVQWELVCANQRIHDWALILLGRLKRSART